MGPTWNPLTNPYGAHFPVYFVPTWAPHTNVAPASHLYQAHVIYPGLHFTCHQIIYTPGVVASAPYF